MKVFKRSNTAEAPYYARFEHQGKPFLKSMDTNIKSVAESRAKEWRAKVAAEKWQDLEKLKLKNHFATIKEVCDAYELAAAERPRTVGNNINSLCNVVRTGLGVADADEQRCNVLTGELVQKFEAARARLIGSEFRRGAGPARVLTESGVRTSTRSMLVQARALFSKDKLHFYSGLKLPDLKSFREQSVAQPRKRLPRALDELAITQILAAAPGLRESDPAVYVAYLLFSRLGMRNIEAKAARWGWIERTGERARMAIIQRPEEGFDPKGAEGRIPMAPDVVAELERFKSQSTDGFIVPGRNKTERAEAVDRRHSAWVGQWIKDRSKTSYELRRFAGSLVLKKTKNIMAVRDFLRHADVKTTQDWYAYVLEETEGLSMGDFIASLPCTEAA